MRVTRRLSMKLGLAAAAVRALPARAATPETLEPRPRRVRLLPSDYPETEVWSYGEGVPGPEIRVAQGARVRRKLVNGLPQPTAIHWHGIRIDNAMDGVPGLTQAAVAPGDSFDYDFLVPDAGTYWYHSHDRAFEQVARGLHGPLIVEEAEGPDTDGEEVLVLDDWRLEQSGAIVGDFGSPRDLSHGGRIGNVVTTNGRTDLARPVRRGERLRLRLINAANARIFKLAVRGMDAWVVALDGMPLPAPRPVSEPMLMAPAQRIDLIVDITAEEGGEAFLLHLDGSDGFAQVAFPVTGRAASARRSVPAPLSPNDMGKGPEMSAATPLTLTMEGGAMGRMDGAVMDGRRMGVRDLAGARAYWAFNGVARMTDTPLATLSRGETVRLTLRNETAWPHGIHLHGVHFRELGADGAPGDMRDTTLLAAGEARDVVFVADNPGDWLLHCHMLGYAASGMQTWMRVA